MSRTPRPNGREVQNQYKRRADLVPNLVETVKGFADQERTVLTQVTEARAKATQVQVPADILTNPEAMKRFQDAQNTLGGALRQLLSRGRALSGHQIGPELPGAAKPARRHRKPHRASPGATISRPRAPITPSS